MVSLRVQVLGLGVRQLEIRQIRKKEVLGVSITLENGSMTSSFCVMTPFFKGRGDSRYLLGSFGRDILIH